MRDIDKLTRRKVLGLMGAAGAGAAMGGAGTMAFFSDEETFRNNQITAGALDLKVDWQQTYNGEAVNAYPDDDGDGLQSLNGVQYGGPDAESDASEIPGVCCTCGDDEYVVSLGGGEYCVTPIDGDVPVDDFYGFSNFESGIGFAESNTSLLFLYRDGEGNVSLVMLHDDGEDGSGGAVTFDFTGTDGLSWQVRDDDSGNDSYGFTSGNISSADWQWSAGKTDGGAIGSLDDFVIGITPNFESGISTWKLLDGDPATEHVLASDLEEDGEPGSLTIASECQALESGDDLPEDVFGDQDHLVELADVKPGDEGEITFSLHLCDNPGHLWLTANNFSESENGVTEPEGNDEDESSPQGGGELAENVVVTIWYDEDCDNQHDEGEVLVYGPGDGGGHTGLDGDNPATLAEAMRLIRENGGRIPLDGEAPRMGYDEGATSDARDCLPGDTTMCVGVKWEVPPDHANEIQTDSVGFDLGFYTEQCRHNDGAGMPPEDQFADLRAATEKYQDVSVAENEGYVTDGHCVSAPPQVGGAMGVHYVNPNLVDGTVDPLQPEGLVYEPTGSGLELVAVEYLATSEFELFGETSDPPGAIPEHSLHAWVWKDNPRGAFAQFNPDVSCPGD